MNGIVILVILNTNALEKLVVLVTKTAMPANVKIPVFIHNVIAPFADLFSGLFNNLRGLLSILYCIC